MTKPQAALWDGSLESIFAVLDEACRTGTVPRCQNRGGPPEEGASLQQELFAAPEALAAGNPGREAGAGGILFPAPEFSRPVFPDLRGSPSAVLLRELSADAFDAVVHAWMSEPPRAAEIIRFAWKVITAARGEVFRAGPEGTEPPGPFKPPAEPAGTPGIGLLGTAAAAPGGPDVRTAAPQSPGWVKLPEARRGAKQAAFDRGDPDVRAVLEAAYKAGREIDRLMGLLRFSPFSPGGGGTGPAVYIARCSPDHHILPGLGEHFAQRFGECPWAVIDEKRRLVLAGEGGGAARLFPLDSSPRPAPDDDAPPDYDSPADYWEDLWRNYHRSINNPDRNNPALQRQFMPRRYWKYLTELR
jgi:hypothetical protein